jgi:sigma-B regulation protein RsbU (phosphoserine phosphatase)
MIPDTSFFDGGTGDWRTTLDHIVQTMREMSLQDDPQAMVRAYGARMRRFQRTDGFVALSRRGLDAPKYRVTRSSTWEQEVDPWQEKDRLPILEGGLMGELLYGDVPRIIDDLHLADDDPGRAYFGENRSLMAIPHYDRGVGQNMVLMLRNEPHAFPPEQFADWVWISSLFGRATQNLVLSAELKKAYAVVERELKVVADIQRSLLPKSIPAIPSLGLAAFYQTSQWAGGDYYDFFPLPDGKWGLLIADVSGHGTPAAVLMAVTHSLAHGFPGPHDPPSALLAKVNHQLSTLYTADNEAFVTAFYGIYDPAHRRLSYSSAGHNPPRLKRCDDSSIESLDGARSLPLGLFAEEVYRDSSLNLRPGDRLAFYTDGITEADNAEGRMYGLDRLDAILSRCCGGDAQRLVDDIVDDVRAFTTGVPPADDQTLLGVVVS